MCSVVLYIVRWISTIIETTMQHFSLQFLYIIGILLLAHIAANNIDYTAKGKCKRIWRPDNLPGKCFGLHDSNDKNHFPELQDTQITSAKECRSVCCNLGEKCVTWQFQNSTSLCKLGPPVRLGFEGADTGDWCDPNPPGVWNGYRLTERDANGHCDWGEQLPNQCFGFGPEKKDQNNQPLNTDQCSRACCEDPKCTMWQEIPGRGCYFGNSDRAWCSKKETPFEGGRKCIPNFCGGLESVILSDKKKGSHRARESIE